MSGGRIGLRLLPLTTVFRGREDLQDEPQPGAVGLVIAEGQLMGDHPLVDGTVTHPAGDADPAALHMLMAA